MKIWVGIITALQILGNNKTHEKWGMTLNETVCCTVPVADRVVDSGVLQRVSLDIGSDWTSLGRQLGCSDADLDNLKYDHRDSGQSEIAYQMLRGWHEQNGSDAKLAVLARALIDVRRPDVARKLQDVRRQ